ncbi:MAG TPA: hypothetical protein VNN80_17760, partial [Polyangiaceae bacterium]|nr:hypothetical protein [Polyangiaceae bacterium]
MRQRMMKRAFWASSIGLGLCAGCGAAGGEDDGSVQVRPEQQRDTADPGQPPATPGQPGASTTGVGGPDFGVGENTDDAVEPESCQSAEREFVPSIPTVYLLVDRSGTMFDLIGNVSAWTALRTGVLEVMRELEGGVRFGFAAFSGANGGVVGGVPQCQLDVPSVAPALNNFQSISQLYEPLERPANSKETPTVLALS